ncbi:MAG: hypothetical protein AUK53_03015 [Betaproteobacteria bacterium CG2_30_59_46]|nr:MAG: hypothetical protein AUK53_03015 [Betaproteobacteria bacterium CG2_30_59_46]PIQ10199.1 MAG: dehydrogenase [Hydrogenophilales bacterium CG18_big_fil_WC_8_21_14_2_50_58_12]PIY00656.1 MAG: dehydrogenase [Hydrogenophilales bacterium CG_4_10_14_3_um_filter_58_23]PJB07062.1 MAG: dehydrogenase [Hydrogenophilales bacterium CG_4_9_14_3_um_filter_59_35]
MGAGLPLWAEDLRLLGWLHTRERDREILLALAADGFPEGLAIGASEEAGAMRAALSGLATAVPGPEAADDELAADYAAIYLTHAYRASPCESVWHDKDHLAWQEPTFAVRAWYRRYGLAVADWRTLPDDHLAYQLEFVARLLEKDETEAAARFLDAHLLTWLPDFSRRVAQRAATPFYRALANVTLATVTGLRRKLPSVEPEAEMLAVEQAALVPLQFVARETWLAEP